MDANLAQALREAAKHVGEVRELEATETQRVVDEIGRKFVEKTESVWWWDGLRLPARRIFRYSDWQTMKAAAFEMLGDRDAPLILVATDDNPPPWIAVSGSLESLLNVIAETHYFEFFLTDASLSWAMFDTHHDELVFVTEGNAVDAPRIE
jgi:hypothetical protein